MLIKISSSLKKYARGNILSSKCNFYINSNGIIPWMRMCVDISIERERENNYFEKNWEISPGDGDKSSPVIARF